MMTNGSAIGYAMKAAKLLKYSPEEIRKLERMMYSLMDEITEEEAEEFYQNN